MNPVLRENLDVLFGERQVASVYFHLLIFLAGVEWGTIYTQSMTEHMWRGSGLLLKVCASAAVVLIVYFTCRLANQEYAPERFKPLDHWLQDRRGMRVLARGREGFLIIHVAGLTLVTIPFLVWAAAISRTPLGGLAASLALLAFYALCYGVWGLVASVVWERETQTREFIIRSFVLFVVVVALAIYPPLNPVIYLFAILDGVEPTPFTIAGLQLSADAFHLGFHLALGCGGLAMHRWTLRRRLLALGNR